MEIMQTFAIALINGSNLLQIPPYNTTPSALHKRTIDYEATTKVSRETENKTLAFSSQA